MTQLPVQIQVCNHRLYLLALTQLRGRNSAILAYYASTCCIKHQAARDSDAVFCGFELMLPEDFLRKLEVRCVDVLLTSFCLSPELRFDEELRCRVDPDCDGEDDVPTWRADPVEGCPAILALALDGCEDKPLFQ